MMNNQEIRIEADMLGQIELPRNCYWGIHTQRAMDNFVLSGRRVNPKLIHALAIVKKVSYSPLYVEGSVQQ